MIGLSSRVRVRVWRYAYIRALAQVRAGHAEALRLWEERLMYVSASIQFTYILTSIYPSL